MSLIFVCFFKKRTAYEMRISDWSSDVCSSDLGDVWQWHQDYGTWLNDDLMPTPRAMNVAIFLDEVNEHNGPLMFIPGSHRLGVLEAGHDVTTTSYPHDRKTVG